MKKIISLIILLLFILPVFPVNAFDEISLSSAIDIASEVPETKDELVGIPPTPEAMQRFEEKDELRLFGALSDEGKKILDDNISWVTSQRTDPRALSYYATPKYKEGTVQYMKIDMLRETIYSSASNPQTVKQKVKAVHDYLAENVYYDYQSVYESRRSQDAYDVICDVSSDGKYRAVCEGYSNLFAEILRLDGIPVKMMTGFSNPQGTDWTSEAAWGYDYDHGWNAVWYDENGDGRSEWVIIDVTWDSGNKYDNDGSGYKFISGNTYTTFFNPSPEVFSEGHKITDAEEDRSVSEDNPYYQQLNILGKPVLYSASDLSGGTVNLENMEYIPSYAFYGLTQLTSIVIPETVKVIGAYAFSECTSLSKISIPENVEVIGLGCFKFCGAETLSVAENNKRYYSIDDTLVAKNNYNVIAHMPFSDASVITVPPVTVIEDNAYFQSENLLSVTIPDTVRRVGLNCFFSSKKLREVQIGKNVTGINWCVFNGCTALEKFSVHPENQYLYSKNNALYCRINTGYSALRNNCLIKYAVACDEDALKLWEETSYIAPYALRYNSLSKIWIPPSVTDASPDSGIQSTHIIYGTPGTYAEDLAAEIGCRFRKTDAIWKNLPDEISLLKGRPARALSAELFGSAARCDWYSCDSDGGNAKFILSGTTFAPPADTAGERYYYAVITGTNGKKYTSCICKATVYDKISDMGTIKISQAYENSMQYQIKYQISKITKDIDFASADISGYQYHAPTPGTASNVKGTNGSASFTLTGAIGGLPYSESMSAVIIARPYDISEFIIYTNMLPVTSYNEGDKFDLTNAKCVIKYINGSVDTVSYSDFENYGMHIAVIGITDGNYYNYTKVLSDSSRASFRDNGGILAVYHPFYTQNFLDTATNYGYLTVNTVAEETEGDSVWIIGVSDTGAVTVGFSRALYGSRLIIAVYGQGNELLAVKISAADESGTESFESAVSIQKIVCVKAFIWAGNNMKPKVSASKKVI